MMKKRIISLIMVLALVFSLTPVYALGATSDTGAGDIELEEVISAVKDLLTGQKNGDLGSLLEGLDYNQLAQLLIRLLEDKLDIAPILGELDIGMIVDVVKALVSGDADISGILGMLDTQQLVELILGLLGDNETLGPVLENLDAEQLVAVVKALIAGGGDLGGLLENLDTNALITLIYGLLGDNEILGPVLENLDAEQLVAVVKALIAGDVDISGILGMLDTQQLVDLILGLLGDNDTLSALLAQLDVQQLVDIIKALIAGDTDLGGVLENLDFDKLLDVVKELLKDNEDLSPLLDKLDTDTLVALVKALIDGDVDVSGIISKLDPYNILKLIAGLIGSELQVDGPHNVTVTETEDAVFSVKVKLSLLDQLNGIEYKYMWLEPSQLTNLNDVNFQNLDIMSLILRLASKSLGNGETFTVQNTTMRDDGREFVCVIYNISEKIFYVTDKATLTVTPFSDCIHSSLKLVRGVEADCTHDGNIAYYQCSTCGKLFLDQDCLQQTNAAEVIIPAKGHSPVEGKAAVAPTCTDSGLTAEEVCSVCGAVIHSQQYVPPKGHTKVVSTEAVAPTCTEPGCTAEYVCADCGVVLEASAAVPAAGHSPVIDVEAKAPTCTEAGCTQGSHCSVCNEVLEVSEPIAPTGHNFVGIQCTECGEYVPFPFVDVPQNMWCRSDVEYVWKHGLMQGVSATTFEPNSSMTRAMFAMVLYRMEGCPNVDHLSEPFTDVSEDYWAYDAIVWAYNEGITMGVTDTTFAPRQDITRAQMVTMLYRYEGSPAVRGRLAFADSSSIAEPYRNAVLWATQNGIVNGYDDNTFRPNNNATRGHMAAIFARYCQM